LDKKIPFAQDTPKENFQCTSCLLPMQYQSKIEDKFLWQCFKCGKKYLVLEKLESYEINETWSPPK
jgi:ribosomal protein L37AE/L43A